MEQNNRTPNFLNNRVDLRYHTLTMLNSGIESLKSKENNEISISDDTRVFIMTNFGLIAADIKELGVSDNSSENVKPGQKLFQLMLEALLNSRNNYLSEQEELIGQGNLRVINDSSFVVLENVTVIPFANPNTKSNLDSLILFTDQIVGISFGTVHA